MKRSEIVPGDVVEDKYGSQYKVLDIDNWGKGHYYGDAQETHFAIDNKVVTYRLTHQRRNTGRGILATRWYNDECGALAEILQLGAIFPVGTKAAIDAARDAYRQQQEDKGEALIGKVRATFGGESDALLSAINVSTWGGDRQQLSSREEAALNALLTAHQIGQNAHENS